ncbi:MAG: hypothetical protein WC917_04800 [Bacilli bacterium]|jgi:hypothetical protein
MKNIEKLAKYVTKNGAEGMLIHTIPGTGNWIICQKIEQDKWVLSLEKPLGNITYNLGTVTTEEHVHLWKEIAQMTIEKASQAKLAKEVKDKIYNFAKKHQKVYRNFLKINKS